MLEVESRALVSQFYAVGLAFSGGTKWRGWRCLCERGGVPVTNTLLRKLTAARRDDDARDVH